MATKWRTAINYRTASGLPEVSSFVSDVKPNWHHGIFYVKDEDGSFHSFPSETVAHVRIQEVA